MERNKLSSIDTTLFYCVFLNGKEYIIDSYLLEQFLLLGVCRPSLEVYSYGGCGSYEKLDELWPLIKPLDFGLKEPIINIDISDHRKSSPPLPLTSESIETSRSFWTNFIIHHFSQFFNILIQSSSNNTNNSISAIAEIVKDEINQSLDSRLNLLVARLLGGDTNLLDHKVEKNHTIEKILIENSELKKFNENILGKYNQVVRKLKLARIKINELQASIDNLKNPPSDDIHHALELNNEPRSSSNYESLIGEYFEPFNLESWFVKKFNPTGPYPIEFILEAKDRGEVDLDTLLREGREEIWRPMREFVELCAPLKIVHKRGEDGELEKKYLIKRSSYRAPFYEVVKLLISGEEIRGYCTSLSTGGCFVELNKDQLSKLSINKVGQVEFAEGSLGSSFETDVEVKNLNEKSHRGVGLAFINLGSEAKDAIEKYVKTHLSEKKRAA